MDGIVSLYALMALKEEQELLLSESVEKGYSLSLMSDGSKAAVVLWKDGEDVDYTSFKTEVDAAKNFSIASFSMLRKVLNVKDK